jgi:hypothetical protein
MNKIVLLSLIFISFSVASIAQKNTPPKEYHVSFTMQQWENVLSLLNQSDSVINQSNAPHLQVQFVQNDLRGFEKILIEQLRSQIIADTVKAKKP